MKNLCRPRAAFGLILLLVAALLSASARAGPLRLVSGPDYPPYADPSLPAGGLATEIVQAAFAASGMQVDPVQFLPWKRGYAAALTGEFDATFPYIARPSVWRRPSPSSAMAATEASPGSDELINRFNAGLARLHAGGSYDEIVRRHLGGV